MLLAAFNLIVEANLAFQACGKCVGNLSIDQWYMKCALHRHAARCANAVPVINSCSCIPVSVHLQ